MVHAAFGIIGPIWFGMSVIEFVVSVLVFSFMLRPIKDGLLLMFWVCLRPNNAWPELPEGTADELHDKSKAQQCVIKYDSIVEYLFVNFQSHLQHFYCAVFILLVNLAVQLVLVVLEKCGGIHSLFLLNA